MVDGGLMKTDREVLEGALELVSRDEGWSKGAYCQYKDNKEIKIHKVHETPLDTMSFCLEGAIRYAAGWFNPEVENRFPRMVMSRMERYRQVQRLEMLVLQIASRDGLTDRASHHNLRLCNFNDDERTSQSDAVLALKKTIEVVSDAKDLCVVAAGLAARISDAEVRVEVWLQDHGILPMPPADGVFAEETKPS